MPCDLDRHGACLWYRCPCSICVPSLNFLRLPIRKIWHDFGLSTNRPCDFDLWTFDLETCNLGTNFGVSGTFRSPVMGQHLSDASRDLATMIFDLGGHGACRWYGSWYPVCVQSLKFIGLPSPKILPVSALVGLVTLTFDLWPWNWCALLTMEWVTFYQFWCF